MLPLYKAITALSAPFLALLLKYRVSIGKEDKNRLSERMGETAMPRPAGQLIWIHAASVGEAQSALILIARIHQIQPNVNFLVTSGTLTSANLMAKRLPPNAAHQFYPLDHPKWVKRFLNHWKPDLALWMESELWPNMLLTLKDKKIPAVLINARLSDKSYKRWKLLHGTIQKILSSFSLIMTQTDKDAERYKSLGAEQVFVTDNLKYSAAPLPYNETDLSKLQNAIGDRKIWLYASTHDGEESLACWLHKNLKQTHSNLLTIIVPRHPERRNDIEKECKSAGLSVSMRGENKNLPNDKTDIYIADTLGELGLFYRLSPIAMIGRSFSNDGGGGHNPIEAAQLDCAVLTGPNVQYQTEIFETMIAKRAAEQMTDKIALKDKLNLLLTDVIARQKMLDAATNFANSKNHIVDIVIENVMPFLETKNKDVA